ncbi:uncharacterized protein LOC141723534 [Apium graveolens]|uniref:uncharacterized protein LOC141723534 n=1 Tax=Apium graveolens TaxID=4045 RepID=UPI003D7AA1BB
MTTPDRTYAAAASSQISTVIDSNHPYYLHPSDNPGMLLTNVVLNEHNYSQWSRSMVIALSSKLKLGFVDGNYAKPALNNVVSAHWMRCNHMVISWILNSVATDIRNSIVYMNSAHLIWKDLEIRYSQSNLPKLFNLRKEIAQITQGSLTIASYYTKFKTLNDELESLSAKPRCTCALCTCGVNGKYDQYESTVQLTQFLMGLSEQFTSLRGQILLMKPVPSLSQCYYILLQEENQRNTQQSSYMTGNSLAMNVKNNYSGSQKKSDSTPIPTNRKSDSNMQCEFCDMQGHSKDTCFCFHGYPQWHRLFGKPKPKPRNSQNKANNVPQNVSQNTESISPDATAKCTGLTDDQYQHLLRMVQATMKSYDTSTSSSVNNVPFAGPYLDEGCRDW